MHPLRSPVTRLGSAIFLLAGLGSFWAAAPAADEGTSLVRPDAARMETGALSGDSRVGKPARTADFARGSGRSLRRTARAAFAATRAESAAGPASPPCPPTPTGDFLPSLRL